MLKIRLSRMGRKKLPFYRIVAMKSNTKRDGKPVSFLGTYDPVSKNVTLKEDEVVKYLKNGAQPTRTTMALLRKQGILAKVEATVKVEAAQ